MASIDINKLKDLNLKDLTTEQLSALNYIRGLGNRQGRGIGTSGLTGSEFATASEASAEAPSMVEAGFGPEEYNPQQRYQTRFQQRGAIDEGPSQFDKLTAQTALGQQLPYDNTNVAPSFVQGGDGGGDPGGGWGGPDMSFGMSVAQDMTPASVGMSALSGVFDSAVSGGLTGGLAGGLGGFGIGKGALAGIGQGLQSFMTSPLELANVLDKVAGAAMQQRSLADAIDSIGATQEDVGMASQSLEARDPATLSRTQTGVRSAIADFDPTARLSSQMLSKLAGLFSDDAGSDGPNTASYGEIGGSEFADAESVASRFSNPQLSSLERYLGPSTYGALQASGMDRAPGGFFSGLSSTDVRDLSSSELQTLMGRSASNMQRELDPMTDAQTLGGLLSQIGASFGIGGDRNGGGEGGRGGNSTGSSAPGTEGRGRGSSARGGFSAYGGDDGGRGSGGMGDIGF